MTIPDHLRYTTEHEWLDLAEGQATVGLTRFAVDALGDIVYLDLPAVGTTVRTGEPCGEIESTKSVSDLYAPATGSVVAVNDQAVARPDLVNSDPYGAGWLLRIRVTEQPDLLDATGYAKVVNDGP